jgi:RNA 3'-terminal phosphate cyclase (ATP)
MIEIDGSYGEGGGQIVRTAVALSAVTDQPVRITKIRQGRSNPGLAHQHVRAIEVLAEICKAKIQGVTVGSAEVLFQPGEICGGKHRIDIGTAGSITLLLQSLLPALSSANGPTILEVRGGTDVRWSPTVDYLEKVALPAIALFGVKASLECHQRGYYLRGGGLVTLEVKPSELKAASIERLETQIRGDSHCSNLPVHVAERQAQAARDALEEAGYHGEIAVETLKVPSTGSGITLWSGYKGGSALGERGVGAEAVGRIAAQELLAELGSPAAVDVHLADQLVPYLALAGGSLTVREISRHTSTNIWTCGHFLETRVGVSPEGAVFRVEGKKR